jgi:hypothetical protein
MIGLCTPIFRVNLTCHCAQILVRKFTPGFMSFTSMNT